MLKLIKRNNKEHTDLYLDNKKLVSPSIKLGQRDTIFFICKKCNKEGHRRISLFRNLNNLTDRDFYCEHRYNFRKSKLVNFPNYSIEKTERQIMEEAGFDRIWDCGNLKFELVCKDT